MSPYKLVRKLLSLFRPHPASNPERDDLVVVTGASNSHFKSVCQFLTSLFRHEPRVKTVVFDLGLTETERKHIQTAFPSVDLRRFEYSRYPDYFDITVNHGAYAWKPVILCDALNEFQGCVCWMDAGNVVQEPLAWIRDFTKRTGFYSPNSSGRISDWTHPQTLEFLKVPESLLDKPNLNGACVAAHYRNSRARALVEQWKNLALIEACIAPAGSSRATHRFDQAVLSVIAHQSGLVRDMPAEYHGFAVHRDID